ncbi:hypothetical protein BD311DRAFT_772984 [Dichomitus squalens]|uniref:DUF6533 domain-containing protein n=1 Tax=Dichomitus squalens TaxID=114155 RepID=A0A4Q9N758_9APHY|nr:hypothetical protein BD311DRAFT_772984 [Dichomitus squalens]
MSTTAAGSDSSSTGEVTELVLDVLQYYETRRNLDVLTSARSQLSQYMGVAMLGVVFYEYLITFDLEVRYIWGRRLTWAKVVFLLNRYTTPVYYIGLVFPLLLPATRLRYATLPYAIKLPKIDVECSSFAGLRIYPISDKNRFITLVVVLLSLFPIATNIVAVILLQLGIGHIPLPPHPTYCVFDDAMKSSEFHEPRLVGLLTNVPLIVVEGIIVVVILLRTATVVLGRKELPTFKFTQLVMRDGIVYFLTLMLINVTNVATYFTDSTPYADFCTMISVCYFNLAGISDMSERTSIPSRWEGMATISLPV